MARNTIRFSKTAIANLPPAPPGKRVFYYDQQTRGLAVQVTASGAKTFYLYRKLKGKPERIHLGLFPEMHPETAQKKAEEYNGRIATGDTVGAKRRDEWTVKDLWDWYLDAHAKPHKKRPETDIYSWTNHISALADVRVSQLARADVRAWHTRVGEETGPSAANKALYILRAMFNLAIAHEVHDGQSPALGIRPYTEDSRDRRLGGDELARLLKAIEDDHDPDARDFVSLLLYTGARKGNVLAMRWDEIDWERNVWRIPETKNGDPVLVPLEELELAILKRRLRDAQAAAKRVSASKPKKPEWVFPGRIDSETGHLVDCRKPWVRIRDRAELVDFHLHDLRRSNGSLMADTGASLPVIGKALGHRDPDSTAIYARLDVTPVREAKQRMLRQIEAARKKREPGDG